MKPLLYLDVDGVLNCLGGEGHEDIEISCEWGVVPIRAPQGVRERLREIDERFEVVWATAWFSQARFVIEALELDLGPWPVLDWAELKITEIIRHCAGRPFAWLDDEIEVELGRLPQGFELPRKQRRLLLEVVPQSGLSELALSALRCFAAECDKRPA